MVRRSSLLCVLVAVPLALAATATAGTRTVTSFTETDPFFACSFPLTATYSGTYSMVEVDKSGSVQLVFTPVGPGTAVVTNPANGRSLSTVQAAGEVLVISDTSFSDHNGGIIWNFVLPGSGAVLQWVGMNNFVTGAFSGRFTGDPTAF